jgi:hypothetical protein
MAHKTLHGRNNSKMGFTIVVDHKIMIGKECMVKGSKFLGYGLIEL